ncbi:MAG: integrase core domain-containing protein, partial [Actinomycetota bacterium]|nr:integrase core domain-containing protein [Actinomycetota bacterium]
NNSDQGSQFTSEEYVNKVELANVKVSMDGRGRVFDNIFTERLWRTLKYEEVYLKDYESCKDAAVSIDNYFSFYNNGRLHSALGYCPPAEIYFGKDCIVSNIKV